MLRHTAKIVLLLAFTGTAGAQQRAAVPTDAELQKAQGEATSVLTKLLTEMLPDRAHAALVDRARHVRSPAARYLLLRNALAIAEKGCRVSDVEFVIGELGRSFAVDEFALRDGALGVLRKHPEANQRAISFAYLGLASIASRDHDAARGAKRVASAVQNAKQAALANGDHDFAVLCDAMRVDFDVRRRAFHTLGLAGKETGTPKHRAKHRAKLGRFRCFFERDWRGGLPLLEADNAIERNILEKRSGDDRSYRTCLSLAESWLSRAKRYKAGSDQEKSLVWRNLASHALSWYYRAWPESQGVERTRLVAHIDHLESRLLKEPAPGRVRFAQKGLRQMIIQGGKSRLEDGVLVLTNEGPAMSATCRYAYANIRSVTIRGGIRSKANQNFRFAIGEFNALCNWEVRPENHFFVGNHRSHTKPPLFQPGKEHVLRIRQIGDEIVFWFDGKVAFRRKGRLKGSVSVYPSLKSEIFVREILIDGDFDPETRVEGPLRKLW